MTPQSAKDLAPPVGSRGATAHGGRDDVSHGAIYSSVCFDSPREPREVDSSRWCSNSPREPREHDQRTASAASSQPIAAQLAEH